MISLVSILLIAPAAGALALLLIDSRRERAIRLVGCVAAGLSFAASAPLWFGYAARAAEWQFTEHIVWLPSLAIRYSVGIDGLSLTMVLLTTVTGVVIMCRVSTAGPAPAKGCLAWILVMQTGLLGAFMALDLLLLFVFWQIATGSAVVLIRRSRAPRRAVARLSGAALLAAAVMLAGILALCFHYHSLASIYTFDVRPLHRLTIPQPLQTWLFAAFFLVFVATMVMGGYLSLRAWSSPAAGAVPLLTAAGLLELGVYGFLRVSLPIFPDASRLFAPAIVVLATAAVALGAVAAFTGTDRRRVIASVSLSPVVAAIAAAFALTPASITASVLLLVAHGLAISLLNLASAVVEESGGTWSLGDLPRGRLAALVPFAGLAVWIALYPAPLLSRLETPVARVVMRVSPEYAAEVADCLKPQAPTPPSAESGLPAGMVMGAPCSDGSTPAVPASPKP